MSEYTHFSESNFSSEAKRIGENLSQLAGHIRLEKPKRFSDELKTVIVDALLYLKIEKAHEIAATLERALMEGNHDLVHEFLNDIAKMQHSEFAQELFQSGRARRAGPGTVLNRNLGKVGRQILGLAEEDAV
jgi:hypothetical protein